MISGRRGGKATYNNSWVTDFEINEGAVVKLVKIGLISRGDQFHWRIEIREAL